VVMRVSQRRPQVAFAPFKLGTLSLPPPLLERLAECLAGASVCWSRVLALDKLYISCVKRATLTGEDLYRGNSLSVIQMVLVNKNSN